MALPGPSWLLYGLPYFWLLLLTISNFEGHLSDDIQGYFIVFWEILSLIPQFSQFLLPLNEPLIWQILFPPLGVNHWAYSLMPDRIAVPSVLTPSEVDGLETHTHRHSSTRISASKENREACGHRAEVWAWRSEWEGRKWVSEHTHALHVRVWVFCAHCSLMPGYVSAAANTITVYVHTLY